MFLVSDKDVRPMLRSRHILDPVELLIVAIRTVP